MTDLERLVELGRPVELTRKALSNPAPLLRCRYAEECGETDQKALAERIASELELAKECDAIVAQAYRVVEHMESVRLCAEARDDVGFLYNLLSRRDQRAHLTAKEPTDPANADGKGAR